MRNLPGLQRGNVHLFETVPDGGPIGRRGPGAAGPRIFSQITERVVTLPRICPRENVPQVQKSRHRGRDSGVYLDRKDSAPYTF